ncbi:MAG: NRDE family protein [Puia sp.]|nr:NRDE family protein [Puia sp.]
MCTVSFLPGSGKIFITSNRDENTKRPPAEIPARQDIGPYSFVCPKDPLAGGTWIATRNDGSAMVLLNGASEKHERQPAYRMSRGRIFWDVFMPEYSVRTFADIALHDIEPFTLVLWQNGELTEMRWDGSGKSLFQKDAGSPHIWSSCTLYTDEEIRHRKAHFEQWCLDQKEYSVDEILKFHLFAGQNEDDKRRIRINRDGKMLTVSVSCIETGPGNSLFHYSDLVTGQNHHTALKCIQSCNG